MSIVKMSNRKDTEFKMTFKWKKSVYVNVVIVAVDFLSERTNRSAITNWHLH